MTPLRIELPTQLDVGMVNAYLFTAPEPVLVDTGIKSAESWQLLQAALAQHHLKIADLRKVIITHGHVDHFGAAGWIASHSQADIWVADMGLPWLLDFAALWQQRTVYYRDTLLPQLGLPPDAVELVLNYAGYIATLCDPVPVERIRPFRLDEILHFGGLEWEVLHTPGHASMQTCFYQPETRQFISGDMLLHKAPTPVVEHPGDGRSRIPALPQFLHSLALVESLDIETVYPGHGEVFTNPRQVIQQQRDRIQARKLECYQHVQNGRSTVFDIVNAMYAHYPPAFRFVGLWMCVGYLDLLKEEGLVTEDEQNGVWYYSSK